MEEERIDLVAVEEEPRPGGFRVSYSTLFSIIIHVVLLVWFIHSYHPVTSQDVSTPISRYVELIRNDPRQFIEAPGKKVETSPLNAPLSNANRKAAMPEPTGDRPTMRPGDGGAYRPSSSPRGDNRPRSAAQSAASPQNSSQQQSSNAAEQTPQSSSSSFAYHPPSPDAQAPTPSNVVEWRNAISKVASLGGGRQGLENGSAGGEKGFSETGPLSFESDWFPWGDYAESMVRRIRVNWESNMPPLLQTGMPGVVVIRFTIHRDGRISDVTILKSSTIPPYDFAAKKAIELSSPLNPLPKEFPQDTERVTCQFFYNQEPPSR